MHGDLGQWVDGHGLRPVAADVVLDAAADLAVRHFQLVERIDAPYELVLDVVTDELDLELAPVVGTEAKLYIGRPDLVPRTVSGIVTRCEYVRTFADKLHVRLLVEPRLALLRYNQRRRIFQGLCVPEIVREVVTTALGAHGARIVIDKLRRDYPTRDYCVQYDETDLQFVLRILGEAGIGLVFAEDAEAEVAVLFDDNAILAPLGASILDDEPGGPEAVPVIPDAFETAVTESVQFLGHSRGMRPRRWWAMAFDWKSQPTANLLSSVAYGDAPDTVGEVHLFSPHRLHEGKNALQPFTDATEAWANRRAEDARARQVRAPGASNLSRLAAGSTLEITHHPHADFDTRYVAVEVVHQADFPEVEAEQAGGETTYHNEFVAQPLEIPLRPPLRRRNRARGPASGIVVGPEGEQIHTDDLGRVQVCMHWDEDRASPTWMRVVHAMAGSGFGTLFLPRVGMEVIVEFLDGDPDRPVVAGCAYNRQNPPPVMLPEHKTKTVLARSRSVPDAEGFNELTFEDAAGEEEVFLHAERNLREVVKASHSTSVGGRQSLHVGDDRTHGVRGSEIVTVEKDRHLRVEGVFGTHVVGSEATYVGGGAPKGEGDPGVTTGQSQLRVDGRRYVWARDELVLEVGNGGSQLIIRPDEIILSSRAITLYAGPNLEPTTVLSLLPDKAHVTAPKGLIEAVEGGTLRLEHGSATLTGNTRTVVETDTPASRLTMDGTITATSSAFCVDSGAVHLDAAAACLITAAETNVHATAGLKMSAGIATTCEGGGANFILANGICDING